MISWITIAILSLVRMSTSGRAPVFSATIRFWISVESLNRPPTLLTIASSFKSSSMAVPFEMTLDDGTHVRYRPFQVVIDDLELVLPGPPQLAAGGPRR